MANDEALPKLSDACGREQALSQLERIRHGELVWFRGCPAIAEVGTVALDTGGGRIVVIDREDVRSVEEADPIFMIGVTPGANVLVRTESLLRLDANECACPEEQLPAPARGSIALQIGDSFRDPINQDYICWTELRMRTVCRWIVGKCSPPRKFCYPELRHVTMCRHEGEGNIA